MKTRTVLLTLALCLVGISMAVADDANMGTWKLNESKSKFPAGATKNTSVVYEAAGDDVKVTVDGTDKDGKAVHSEWTGKFDGKDYAVTGEPTSDTRAYKMVNANTFEMTMKKGGKMAGSGKIVVSADGKTRTVTTSGMDSMGMKMDNSAVYDKQ